MDFCDFERFHTSSVIHALLSDGAMFLKASLHGLRKRGVLPASPQAWGRGLPEMFFFAPWPAQVFFVSLRGRPGPGRCFFFAPRPPRTLTHSRPRGRRLARALGAGLRQLWPRIPKTYDKHTRNVSTYMHIHIYDTCNKQNALALFYACYLSTVTNIIW